MVKRWQRTPPAAVPGDYGVTLCTVRDRDGRLHIREWDGCSPAVAYMRIPHATRDFDPAFWKSQTLGDALPDGDLFYLVARRSGPFPKRVRMLRYDAARGLFGGTDREWFAYAPVPDPYVPAGMWR